MAILPIRQLGDPVLRTPASPVDTFDRALKRLASDMFDTMDDAPGVGLAAPQVGVPRRMFVFDDGDERGVVCNPRIVWHSDETQVGEEGCLSLKGVYFPVERAMHVRVEAQDVKGNPITLEGSGLRARIFQHETDHLDGVLFIDRLDAEHRKEAMRLLRERDLLGAPPPAAPRTKAL